jgi:hypothetical protein
MFVENGFWIQFSGLLSNEYWAKKRDVQLVLVVSVQFSPLFNGYWLTKGIFRDLAREYLGFWPIDPSADSAAQSKVERSYVKI